MAIAIRAVATGTADDTVASVSATTDTTPQSGDLVVAFVQSNYRSLSNINAPTGGPSTWTEITGAQADAGVNEAHSKAYWGVLSSSGQFTATSTFTGQTDQNKAIVLVVLSGAATTSPVDAAAGAASATASVTHPAPSVSPTTSDAFLICTDSSAVSATTSYTPPTGMTERWDVSVAFHSLSGATEQLSASGATGTRSFTPANNISYAVSSVAIKTAAGTPVAKSGTSHLGLAATATAVKVAAVTGIVALGLSAHHSQPDARQVQGVAHMGLAATSAVTKIAASGGVSALGLTAWPEGASRTAEVQGESYLGLSTHHSGVQARPQTGITSLGLTTTATLAKVSVQTGNSHLGIATTGTAAKAAPQTGITAIGLAGTGHATQGGAIVGYTIGDDVTIGLVERDVVGPDAQRTATGPALSRVLSGPDMATEDLDGPDSVNNPTPGDVALSRALSGPALSRTITGPEV